MELVDNFLQLYEVKTTVAVFLTWLLLEPAPVASAFCCKHKFTDVQKLWFERRHKSCNITIISETTQLFDLLIKRHANGGNFEYFSHRFNNAAVAYIC